MKRRSARPFMVEVKHTRTARTSLTSPQTATRSNGSLWLELIEAETRPTQPELQAASPPRQEEQPVPARRVLPNLMPMFDVADEPEASASEVESAPKPRVRRPRAVAPAAARTLAAEPAVEPRRVAPRPEPAVASGTIEASARAIPAEPEQAPSPRPVPSWRRGNALRLGERWKRRLPHYCR